MHSGLYWGKRRGNALSHSINRRPEKALTAQLVRTVQEPGKYFDGQGLYLRVEPNGSRFWVQRITIRGKRCELGLGPPSLVPLAEARAVALANRKLAREGGDPLQAKREAAAVLSFEEAARKVHEMHSPTWKSPKHAAQFISTLETYAFPRLGRLKVPDVTTADVLAVLSPIWVEKAETARRVRQRIGTVMKWAIAQGWRQDNPAENIAQALPKSETVKANRKALPYAEVAGCIQEHAEDAWDRRAAGKLGNAGPRSFVLGHAGIPTSASKPQMKAEAAAFEVAFEEEFWPAYPRKDDKGRARKAFLSAIKSKKATVAELVNGAMRYAAEREGEDPKFTKQPATWLNAEAWLNAAPPAVPAASRMQSGRPQSRSQSAMAGILSYGLTQEAPYVDGPVIEG